MNKLQYTLSSLVAAVPAALLGWLMTMAFVNHFENMTMAAQVVSGLTLALCVVLVAIPVYVLFVWSPAAATATAGEADMEEADLLDEEVAGDPLIDDEGGLEDDEELDTGDWDDDADEGFEDDEAWDDEDEPA